MDSRLAGRGQVVVPVPIHLAREEHDPCEQEENAESHGGSVRACTLPGSGACFEVRLPAYSSR